MSELLIEYETMTGLETYKTNLPELYNTIPKQLLELPEMTIDEKIEWLKPKLEETPLLDERTIEKIILARGGCGNCKLTFIA